MKKYFLLFLLMPFMLYAKNTGFDQVVFFGDSLSDTGNLYRDFGHILPKSPPYYKGHFSNGEMWVEKFYRHFFPSRDDVADYNYAFGGASAFFSLEAPLPYTLDGEVSNYLTWYAPDDLSRILYVIWIGGNNYIRGPQDGDSTSTKAVNAIVYDIERLISYGANKFLVPNLPDLGTMPEATEEHKDSKLHKMTRLHNDKLASALNSLQAKYPSVVIIPFDAEETLKEVFNDPDKFHMHHVKEACYTGGYTFKPTEAELKQYLVSNYKLSHLSLTQTKIDAMLQNPDVREALKVAMFTETHDISHLDCHDYLFWDHVHPTTVAHGFIADYMIEAVLAAGLSTAH